MEKMYIDCIIDGCGMSNDNGLTYLRRHFGVIVSEKKRKFREKKSVVKDAAIELVYKAYEMYHNNKLN